MAKNLGLPLLLLPPLLQILPIRYLSYDRWKSTNQTDTDNTDDICDL